MIPGARKSAHQRLQQAGEDIPALMPCLRCRQLRSPVELVDATDYPEIEHDEACSSCLIDVNRDRNSKKEKAKLQEVQPWDSELGNDVRARRNQLLIQWAWAVQRGSPLTQKNQAEFEAFFRALNRLTVKFPNPSQVVWPVAPVLEYEQEK